MVERGRKVRWRAWLRAIHRDVGYLAIGFTLIYAVSGIAQNHIEDWGEVSFKPLERTVAITALPLEISDAEAIARVASAAGLGPPTASLRAGDEIRLDYAGGSKVVAIGERMTIQTRERRALIGVANWLHTARGKPAWKYLSDGYAVLLVYLAISGMFMIKGKLGLAWRGTIVIALGVLVPVLYVVISGGPNNRNTTQKPTTQIAAPTRSLPSLPSLPSVAPQAGSAVLTPLPPEVD